MRIFGWSADPGTAYWRLQLPLGELARRGHDAMISDRAPDCVIHDAEADVFVASRTANPGPSQTFQRLCREARMLCVYETDDDPFSITPDNRPALEYFSQPGILDNVRANLAAAHLVTTSTPHLAEVLSQHTSAPIVVLPNRVPRWLTERPAPWERPAGPLVVGYTGGASHVRDFGEAAKPLRAWLQRQGDAAVFHSVGVDHGPRVATIRGRTRHTDWSVNVEDYLRSIDFHVGLAPLRDTLFARSKSPLKLLEYGALGIPAVASPVGPYAEGSPGALLASSPAQWRGALDFLGADPDARHELGVAGRLWACQNLIEDHADEWLDAYTSASAGSVAA